MRQLHQPPECADNPFEKRVPEIVEEIYSGKFVATAQGGRSPARPDPVPRAFTFSSTTPSITIGRTR
jgi:hypothetical protein